MPYDLIVRGLQTTNKSQMQRPDGWLLTTVGLGVGARVGVSSMVVHGHTARASSGVQRTAGECS